MLENVKKKRKSRRRRRRSCLALNKKKRETKKNRKSNLHSERGGRLSWGNPVKKDGRPAGKRECRREREREREREFLAGEVWTRERKMPAGGDGIR
jgi:hypothetical protein